MPNFILNSNEQLNGDHEVHNTTEGCNWMPLPGNQIDLGWYTDCNGAVLTAKIMHNSWRINGCAFCCPTCHTS